MISHEDLLKEVKYDPESGAITWARSRRGISEGKVAGAPDADGYIQVTIWRRNYRAHRLAWFYTFQRWPTDQIDHIDGDPSNNRISNLRECNTAQNGQNRKVKSGKATPLGVVAAKGGFQAQIVIGGKTIYLGRFASTDEASKAYLSAKSAMHTFNPNLDSRRDV